MNAKELQVEIIRNGKTNQEMIERTGMSAQSFYNKMQGKTEFKNSEILNISKILGLSFDQINTIFFDRQVN